VSWQIVLTAMLPEHLLLAGIIVLLGLELGPRKPRGLLVVALVAVAAATAAALWLAFIGYAAAPFPGQY
jgi:hypothetical protein